MKYTTKNRAAKRKPCEKQARRAQLEIHDESSSSISSNYSNNDSNISLLSNLSNNTSVY